MLELNDESYSHRTVMQHHHHRLLWHRLLLPSPHWHRRHRCLHALLRLFHHSASPHLHLVMHHSHPDADVMHRFLHHHARQCIARHLYLLPLQRLHETAQSLSGHHEPLPAPRMHHPHSLLLFHHPPVLLMPST